MLLLYLILLFKEYNKNKSNDISQAYLTWSLFNPLRKACYEYRVHCNVELQSKVSFYLNNEHTFKIWNIFQVCNQLCYKPVV